MRCAVSRKCDIMDELIKTVYVYRCENVRHVFCRFSYICVQIHFYRGNLYTFNTPLAFIATATAMNQSGEIIPYCSAFIC